MHSTGSSGILYHMRDRTLRAKWELCGRYGYFNIDFVVESTDGKEIAKYTERVPQLEDDRASIGSATIGTVKHWAKHHAFVLEEPEYPLIVPWYVKEHLGNQVVVIYNINGVEHKATLNIPGVDDKITEEVVKLAIENEVKSAARRRRFTGMKGEVAIPKAGGDANGTGTKDAKEGLS